MGLTEQIFETLLLLRPWDIDLLKVRVGHERDGGYIMADKFDISDTVISIGINKESSFDRDMAKLGKRIFQYDHTIDAPPEKYENAQWFKLGLGPQDDLADKMISLASIVRDAGLKKNQGILKMDIENAEWDVFSAVAPETLSAFSQISMEIHRLERLTDNDHRKKVKASLSKVNEQFTLFHVHANNCSKMTRVDSFFTPECLEVSYIKTDLVNRAPSKTLYPTEIDRPNNPRNPEYYLWMFPYLPSDLSDVIMRRSLRQTESFWGQ
ncbi:hypothetical protein ABK249_20595 [Neorhizobium sp. Rsf11]|uniref:Methyltransferase domain-containing protein n=1 Tax=Neorhizobium phenanthreniclasticum TaxID=3157917 RepID=A0ABV0M658_9HYPH